MGAEGIGALRQEPDSVRKGVQVLPLDQVPALLADVSSVQYHLHGEALLNAQAVMVSARHFGIPLKRWIAPGENVSGGLPQKVHAAVEDLWREDDWLNVRQVRAVVVVATRGLLGDPKTARKAVFPFPNTS